MSQQNLCKHLRTKAMFIPALAQESAANPDAAGHSDTSPCWCNCTLTETGPDDRPVGHQVCQPTRPCFER